MLGTTSTQLTWDFNENKKKNDWGKMDYVNLIKQLQLGKY